MRLIPLLVLVSTELAAGFSLSGHIPTKSPCLISQSTPYPFLKLRAGLRRSRHSGVSMKRKGEKDALLDPYVVLGVQRKATMDDIKRAYRKLSQTYHPDVNSEEGAKDKFIEISVAYSVLGDEDERRKFDFSKKMGLSDDFAERVSGFREAAGPQYREVADKAEELIENKWAVVAFSSFMPVMLLLIMSFAKDQLRDLMLGPR